MRNTRGNILEHKDAMLTEHFRGLSSRRPGPGLFFVYVYRELVSLLRLYEGKLKVAPESFALGSSVDAFFYLHTDF